MDIEDCDIKMDFDDTRIPLETTNARGYRILIIHEADINI